MHYKYLNSFNISKLALYMLSYDTISRYKEDIKSHKGGCHGILLSSMCPFYFHKGSTH